MNYYVKHLVQDLDGQPSETLSWLEDYGDPNLISSLDMLSPFLTIFHHLARFVPILPGSCGTVWHPAWPSGLVALKSPEVPPRFITRLESTTDEYRRLLDASRFKPRCTMLDEGPYSSKIKIC